MRHGFWYAYGHVRPDVVVFLGDLLDEGSKGSIQDFLTYIDRFSDVFQLPAHTKVWVLTVTCSDLYRTAMWRLDVD